MGILDILLMISAVVLIILSLFRRATLNNMTNRVENQMVLVVPLLVVKG